MFAIILMLVIDSVTFSVFQYLLDINGVSSIPYP